MRYLFRCSMTIGRASYDHHNGKNACESSKNASTEAYHELRNRAAIYIHLERPRHGDARRGIRAKVKAGGLYFEEPSGLKCSSGGYT
jgi:hypothetical protein